MSILVVDDDPLITMVASRTLRAAGFQVDTVMSAEAALRWMQARHPRLLVLDAKMPGMDGFALLEMLKSDPRLCDVPVVMVTGSRAAADVLRARQLGAAGYVAKPFDPDTLLRRVKLCLDGFVPSAATTHSAADDSEDVQESGQTSWLI